jgi:hypothetical protein
VGRIPVVLDAALVLLNPIPPSRDSQIPANLYKIIPA